MKRIQVLLIEDDMAIADLYGSRLIRDGYAVAFARDGAQGLEMARAGAPHLIYLDIRLPKVDGLAVLRELRNDPSSAAVPVVILTNYDDPEVRSTGLQLGARQVLLKSETTPAQLSLLTREWIAAA
jgi:DNA-binding response OmpR family regulator